MALIVVGALGLITTAVAVKAQTGQNLVINGNFESGNVSFKTGYTLGLGDQVKSGHTWSG
jgi:hypothetical protein